MNYGISSVDVIIPTELTVQLAYAMPPSSMDIRTFVLAAEDLRQGVRFSGISSNRIKCYLSELPTLAEYSVRAKAGAMDVIQPNGVRCINWLRIANISSDLTEEVNIIIDKSKNCQVVRLIKAGAEIVVYPCGETLTEQQPDCLKLSPEPPKRNTRVVDRVELYRVRRVLKF